MSRRRSKVEILMGLPGDLAHDMAKALNVEIKQLWYVLPMIVVLSIGYLYGLPWLMYVAAGAM